jgi:hypothetical protein
MSTRAAVTSVEGGCLGAWKAVRSVTKSLRVGGELRTGRRLGHLCPWASFARTHPEVNRVS